MVKKSIEYIESCINKNPKPVMNPEIKIIYSESSGCKTSYKLSDKDFRKKFVWDILDKYVDETMFDSLQREFATVKTYVQLVNLFEIYLPKN